jgi:hypothetical protein
LDAERPEDLPFDNYHTVLAGDDQWAVKNPVIMRDRERWHMCVCCHPLTDPGRCDKSAKKSPTGDSASCRELQDCQAAASSSPQPSRR